MVWESFTRGISLFVIGALLMIAPAAASSIAVYGSTSGFIPGLHADRFTVAYQVPGNGGEMFDNMVANFTAPSVDVIFIGGDDTFNASTASAIEQAVWDGKILVIGYPATEKFGDSLPFAGRGTDKGSDNISVANPDNVISQAVFSGLRERYNASEPVEQRLTGSIKPGSVSLLKYDSGEPALLYRNYGNGYVAEWTFSAPSSYLGNDDADTVNFRLISALLDLRQKVPVPSVTTTVPVQTTTEAPTAPTQAPRPTGNITIHSSPLGADVFLDGIYKGKTPLELSGVSTGYHSVKMTMDGHYDYDGSAYVVNGENITAFGSLPLQARLAETERTTAPATPVPTATQASDPLTNPTIIAAVIGTITAGIGAFATIYSQRTKGKKE
jgi:hypothetical protein